MRNASSRLRSRGRGVAASRVAPAPLPGLTAGPSGCPPSAAFLALLLLLCSDSCRPGSARLVVSNLAGVALGPTGSAVLLVLTLVLLVVLLPVALCCCCCCCSWQLAQRLLVVHFGVAVRGIESERLPVGSDGFLQLADLVQALPGCTGYLTQRWIGLCAPCSTAAAQSCARPCR